MYINNLLLMPVKTRPPMLERGSYIPWASHFRRYLNRKRETRNWLNKAIDEGPYEFRMFTPSETNEPKIQTEDDLRGDDLKYYEAEIQAMNSILISIPNVIYNSMDACTTSKAMWEQVERLMRGAVENQVDRKHVSIMSSIGLLLNKERHSCQYTIVLLINQAIVQGDRVNIQSKNSGNEGRNTRRAYVQEEVIENTNVQKDAGNIQRTLRTASSGTVANVQCYNFSEKGHYARNCPKPRVRDSNYFIEQMLLAKHDEAGVILTDEQNDFLFADASRMEEIEESSANI
uniref:Ribonuclease H-like domain-containing protein n=1 Tax=Tanacetum cinerariifolium TaxID=118510 RepID=A0A6L2JZY8_TANCI|nr:ribonuclease H-like domain-containing protein [Tanacetum cinerariifolium]